MIASSVFKLTCVLYSVSYCRSSPQKRSGSLSHHEHLPKSILANIKEDKALFGLAGIDEVIEQDIGNESKIFETLPKNLVFAPERDSRKEVSLTGHASTAGKPSPLTKKSKEEDSRLPENFVEKVKDKIQLRDVMRSLRRSRSALEDLKNGTDGIETITKDLRKYWNIVSSNRLMPAYVATNVLETLLMQRKPLNYYYPQFMSKGLDGSSRGSRAKGWNRDKDYALTIMNHWIYRAQFNMQYSQRLRTKYVNDTKFKMGFSFALLRQLKLEQKMLYNAMEYHWETQQHNFYHLRIYERVNRLEVDIKDAIKFIKQQEYLRKYIEDPHFYFHFEQSTPPFWRRFGGKPSNLPTPASDTPRTEKIKTTDMLN